MNKIVVMCVGVMGCVFGLRADWYDDWCALRNDLARCQQSSGIKKKQHQHRLRAIMQSVIEQEGPLLDTTASDYGQMVTFRAALLQYEYGMGVIDWDTLQGSYEKESKFWSGIPKSAQEVFYLAAHEDPKLASQFGAVCKQQIQILDAAYIGASEARIRDALRLQASPVSLMGMASLIEICDDTDGCLQADDHVSEESA